MLAIMLLLECIAIHASPERWITECIASQTYLYAATITCMRICVLHERVHVHDYVYVCV